MPLWKRWWLLFSVIWAVVAALQAATIVATSEEPEKAWRPILAGIGVPALLYLLLWLWSLISRGPPPSAK